MQATGPQVIEVPANWFLLRFRVSFCVREGGEFWRHKSGARRVWRTRQQAEQCVNAVEALIGVVGWVML